MKYKLILNFYIDKDDNARLAEYLEKAMVAFRATFPDAKTVDEPFATVTWDDKDSTDVPSVGKVEL